jgi:hypothetical protein
MDTQSTTRYCEICERDERCHCPAIKSYCDVCCPPRLVQSEYAQALGEPAPASPKVFLVGRLSA